MARPSKPRGRSELILGQELHDLILHIVRANLEHTILPVRMPHRWIPSENVAFLMRGIEASIRNAYLIEEEFSHSPPTV